MTFIIGGNRRICRGCGGEEAAGCDFVLLDVAAPSGVCFICAEALSWHPALLTQVGFADAGEEAA